MGCCSTFEFFARTTIANKDQPMKTIQTKLIRASIFCSTVVFGLFAARPVLAIAPPEPPANDDSAYATGTRAMNDHRWQDAIVSFDKVIDAKNKDKDKDKDKRVDAAFYWKAYSLQKIGSASLALATCNQLRSQYPASSWNNDCGAIAINVDPNIEVTIPPMPPMPKVRVYMDRADRVDREDTNGHATDEDLKILALNSLLNQDPTKAIPLLRGILTGNQSMNMKKHALFVLAQSKSPEAESVLHDAAVGKMGPELQSQAVQSIAIYEGKRANDTLVEVYRATSDAKLKRSVINSIFITKDAAVLVDLARNEKDLDLKRDIVSKLAIMHDKVASDYMLELLK
jgi:hypothetical protein